MAQGFAYELRKAAYADWQRWDRSTPLEKQAMRVHYRRGVGLRGKEPWCAAAASDWIQRAIAITGHTFSKNLRSAGAKALINLLIAAGWQLITSPALLQPSDVVAWNRGATDDDWEGHIGLVLAIQETGGFKTIEANSGNAVRKKQYPAGKPGRFYKAARPPAT